MLNVKNQKFKICSRKIKGNFLIERLESIKQVLGYDMEDHPPGLKLFDLSLNNVNKENAPFSEKVILMKKMIPYFTEQIKNGNECVIRLFGELSTGEIPDAYPYIFTTGKNNRYYMPERAYHWVDDGYIDTWVTFDFNKTTLKEIPYGGTVVLEGVVYEKGIPDDFNFFFSRDWGNREVKRDILSKCIVYFETNFDWDYLSFASKIPMDEIAEKLQKGLDSFDNEE